eukprot:m.26706 g.26706  ORF g.26706 m.26706 type:complete len:619 (-) comp4340_c0_seq1:99-1955(-)
MRHHPAVGPGFSDDEFELIDEHDQDAPHSPEALAGVEGINLIHPRNLRMHHNKPGRHGAAGSVRTATWIGPSAANRRLVRNTTTLAIKTRIKAASNHETQQTIFHGDTEVAVLSRLSHKNIVTFFGVLIDDEPELFCSPAKATIQKRIQIVMEYCELGSLRTCIENGTLANRSFEFLLGVASQVLMGLKYLHSDTNPTIVHRDLKCMNVLARTHGADKAWEVKLCDFGSATDLPITHCTDLHVTPAWAAPEVLREDGELMGPPLDIWSFGVLLWELITFFVPFEDFAPHVIIYWGGNGKLKLHVPDDVVDEVKEILNQCWQFDPRDRPTADELLHQLRDLGAGDAFDDMSQVIAKRTQWRERAARAIEAERQEKARAYKQMKQLRRWYVVQTSGLLVAVVGIVLLGVALAMQAGDVTKARTAYDKVNTDHNTHITLEELETTRAVLEKLGISVDSDAELYTILQRYDTHRDGTLDSEEFEDLVASETSWYGFLREWVSDNLGMDPGFSLSVPLRRARNAMPFGDEIATVLGSALLSATFVAPRRWLASDEPLHQPVLVTMSILACVGLGAFLFSLGTADVLYTHLGTREMVQMSAMIVAVWLIVTLIHLRTAAMEALL